MNSASQVPLTSYGHQSQTSQSPLQKSCWLFQAVPHSGIPMTGPKSRKRLTPWNPGFCQVTDMSIFDRSFWAGSGRHVCGMEKPSLLELGLFRLKVWNKIVPILWAAFILRPFLGIDSLAKLHFGVTSA